MKNAFILLVLPAVFLVNQLTAQPCTTLGQNPTTAFPVCGTNDFSQTNVPTCGGSTIPVPCNTGINFQDLNPFWYRFTCYRAGTLGLELTPNDLQDDYDWQIFDVTGRNVNDVFTEQDMFVAGNWSGRRGVTGASNQGTSLIECNDETPKFSSMPVLEVGHEYLLLVSNFSQTQSGYTLSFTGGTAEISDQLPSEIQAADGFCTGNSLVVHLNKPVKCSSIASDGSDFAVNAPGVQVSGAGSPACLSSFTTDSIVVQLSGLVQEGTYQVSVQQGSDMNSFLNICDVEMPIPASASFRMYETVSAAFTHNIQMGCEIDTLQLEHDGANSVNYWMWTADQFIVTNRTGEMRFNTTGDKTVTLVVANQFCTDTNSVTFNLPPKVDAAFAGPSIICSKDPATFTDQSTGGAISYLWNFGESRTSNAQNPTPFNFPFNNGEVEHRVTLTVTDGMGCTDTAMANIVVVGNCNIVVPSAFSPNNDGRNDQLYPTNAFNADDLVFRVFNRFGQVVFESHDWQKKWDGKLNGIPQPTGVYVWMLSYKLKTNGVPYFFRGTTTLVR